MKLAETTFVMPEKIVMVITVKKYKTGMINAEMIVLVMIVLLVLQS